MDKIVGFFRDTLSGLPYILLVIGCMFFIFAIIGYLCNLKYKKDISN